MLALRLNEILKNRPLLVSLAALVIGQVLYLFGFGWLWVPALVLTLAIGLPFPAILTSLVSRLVVGFVLTYGFMQVAALVQFFALPDSDFKVLSTLTTLLVVIAVLVLYRHGKGLRPVVDTKDLGALVTAAFFIVPFAILCFWGNNPVNLTKFGGLQSPDGSAHNVAFDEMYGKQHLTYRTNPTYYPKGYHIANALVMDTFGLHKKQNDWLTNARVFVAQYIVWGGLLAASLFYLAFHLLHRMVGKVGASKTILLAVILGPAVSLFYILPFANQGFLNFYFICIAFACSLLFVEGFELKTPNDRWLVLAYFLFAVGITMSWGPILLPIVALTPVLYVISKKQTLKGFIKKLLGREYLVIWVGAALLAVPLYIHFTYASENAFNAYGSIRVFNYALLAVGLVLTLGLALSSKVSEYIRSFATNALVPAWLLVGGMAFAQYFLVGEPRYYSIKTAYLLELVLVAVAAAALLWFVAKKNLSTVGQWLLLPFAFGALMFLLISANGNPVEHVRNMVIGKPANFASDAQKITDLGVRGELKVSNNLVLHYIPGENKLIGNALIPNWANGLAPTNEGNPVAAECNSKIFSIFAYGSGSAEEQQTLRQAIKTCIEDRVDKQKKPYYIITSPESVPHLKELFGDKPTFL